MEKEKEYLKLWLKWVKEEWFTILAIIFILIVAGWQQSQIGEIVKQNVNDCKAHYQKLIEKTCPAIELNEPIQQINTYNGFYGIDQINQTEQKG